MKLTIVVPLPPKELHPNARVHWAQKARATKQARGRAWAAAMESMVQCGSPKNPPLWAEASVVATFYVKDKRGMSGDRDGRISSLKATMDGISDAGVIKNDRGFTWKAIEHRIDKANPRVEIIVEQLEAP